MSEISKNSFIKSDKVIRYKLGAKTADVLATLLYKHNYWRSKGKLVRKGVKECFFVSLNDLTAETTFSVSVIRSCINKLKKEGLLYSIRQGLNKPNLYTVDEQSVELYIERYRVELKNWQLKIIDSSLHQGIKRMDQNDASIKVKNNYQELKKESATNNKSTNNKSTNNVTNQASLGKEIDLEYQLEKEILNLRSFDETESQVKSLFFFLCNLVPSFNGFKMSDSDRDLILKLTDSEIQEYKLASKIFSNASAINEGGKESRFGNLFVGVEEMITNYDQIFA